MRVNSISQFNYKTNNTKKSDICSNPNLKIYSGADIISFGSKTQTELLKEMADVISREQHGHLEILFNRRRIQNEIASLAASIKMDYHGEDVYVICVLNGAKRFSDDLTKKMGKKVNGTIKLASYEGTESSGNIMVKSQNFPGIEKAKHILVVEDIVDTGNSMKFLLDKLRREHPEADIRLCAMLDKPEARKPENNFKIDYCGFRIGKEFVIGYGLDYNQQGRELNNIYQVIKD